jgi:hypothetical protein
MNADSAVIVRTLATALDLSLGAFGTGWLLGLAARQLWGRRDGVLITSAVVATPSALVIGLDAWWLLIGVWDALFLGMLASAGILLALHRALANPWRIVLVLGALSIALPGLELASRAFLPPAPAFPSSAGPTLFMSDAIQAARATGFAPTQAGAATCYAIYGQGEAQNPFPPTAFPATWQPRGVPQHVLHLGDSMVWGSANDGRFTDDLNRLEPDVEHVNAAIAGTAPDVYLSLLRLFIARHDFTAVVMHLTPNDYWGVDDAQYPCSNWRSLLVYGDAGTRLRFATAYEGSRSSLWWLVQNSPPPYVLRACVRYSSFAAHLAAAFVQLGQRLGGAPAEVSDTIREAHLTAVLRDARDELRARRIPLIVDSFRDRPAIESGGRGENSVDDRMQRIAAGLGIVTLDTWEPLRAAVQAGVQPFTNAGGTNDPHFNAAGHALIARWLHDELPKATDSARTAMDRPPS